MSTELNAAREQFAHHVQRALSALYDPGLLSASLLISLLGIRNDNDRVAALRQTLIKAIESLKPNEPIPAGSRGWRVYQVLRRRYTEQLTQHEVAANLGLSIRQVQREEKIAREVMADRLWATHNVSARIGLLTGARQSGDSASDLAAPSAAEELETFSKLTPVQIIHVGDVVHEVLNTLEPVLSASGTITEFDECVDLPAVAVKVPMLRQALFDVLSVAGRLGAGERLIVTTCHERSYVVIDVRAMQRFSDSEEEPGVHAETLDMARQLLDFCHASLHSEFGGKTQPSQTRDGGVVAFSARAQFEIAEVFTVLVIDDNDDTRQLLQRYLYGTRYQFVGAEDAQQALAVVQQSLPKAIVLDVMMPKQDGWSLIGQLRNLPRLQKVPIIVSTILPQKDLAYALGAAEFIRKPIKRSDLLAALDRQLGQQTESSSSP